MRRPSTSGARVEIPSDSASRTRRLLVCGLAAGPIFVAVTAVEMISRQGFDIRRHGISLLSLGDRGWIQVANFLLAGVLSITFARGVRRLLGLGPGSTAAPVLITGYGVGLIVTGLFLVDPGEGFPPGTADGVPALSWHGAVHAIAPPAAFLSLVGVCFVLARRYGSLRRWAWAGYCVVTALAALALIFWPGGGGSVRSALAVLVTSTWMTAVAADLIGSLPTGAISAAGSPPG